MAEPIRVAISGAAGQIAYSLIFRVAAGEVYGADRPVHLRLLEIPPMLDKTRGVVMELEDCAFPTLADVTVTSDPKVAFEGAHRVMLVGSRPRGPGMERSDLIRINGPIFVEQGKALDRSNSDVRVMVVGNPCNTNCLIAMNNSDVPPERFGAMMRLDQNRARTMLAKKAGVPLTQVTNVLVWGNHSNNQYPDIENPRIGGQPVGEVLDQTWLRESYIPQIQQRGAAVIEARQASSAASAANAALDHVRSFLNPTPAGDWFCAGVVSKGEYGVDPGLMFGFPLTSPGNGTWKVVEGLPLSDWAKVQFNRVLDELRQERDVVKDLLRK